jgi:hypothetical protein
MIETDPLRDQLHLPDPVPAEYSENLILMGYDLASDHAFYWHWSRMHTDPDRWEGLIAVYRPGGEILCRREFGAHGNNIDVADSGNCSFTVGAPLKRWHAHYSGHATRTTTDAAADGLVPDGPTTSLEADLVFTGVFDTFSAGAAMDNQDWGDGHLEQGGRVTGTIAVDGDPTRIDCLAFRDHTWGRRNYLTLDRHAWCYGFFPSGRTFLVLEARHDGDEHAQFGFVVQDGTMFPATPRNTPDLEDPTGEPRRFTVALDCELGAMSIEVEMTHAMSFHLAHPLEMPLGTSWSDDRNTINVEGPTIVKWNGERGTGWIERTNRAGRLARRGSLSGRA